MKKEAEKWAEETLSKIDLKGYMADQKFLDDYSMLVIEKLTFEQILECYPLTEKEVENLKKI